MAQRFELQRVFRVSPPLGVERIVALLFIPPGRPACGGVVVGLFAGRGADLTHQNFESEAPVEVGP
jgi:hypothetical protein